MASRPLYRLERISTGGKVEAINNYHSKSEAERDAKAFRRYIKAAPLGNVWKYRVRTLTTSETTTSENPAGIRAQGTRITKKEWQALGGLSNPHLWRRQSSNGSWRYYKESGSWSQVKANPASIRAQVRRLPSGQIQLKIPLGRSENPHGVIEQLKRVFGKRVKAVEMVQPKRVRTVRKVRKVRKSTSKRKR